jgi:DNA-binding helix-hairpin-helix protein with protein kinase domain
MLFASWEVLDQWGVDWKRLLIIAHNLAHLVATLHTAGYVIGDLSPKNVMVRKDGMVSLLDCDSYQFRHGGSTILSESRTNNYAAPESARRVG